MKTTKTETLQRIITIPQGKIIPRESQTKIVTEFHNGLAVEHSIPGKIRFGTPILMVHGMWGDGTLFRTLMIILGSLGYECYAPSLHGHGKSAGQVSGATIDSYILDVEIMIQKLGGKVILLGHSMGSLICSQIAMRNKNLVAFVALTSAPPRGVLMGTSTITRMPKYFGSMLTGKPVILNRIDARALLLNTAISDDEFERQYNQMCPESGVAAREITLMKYSMSKSLCPTLVVAGGSDKITPNQAPVVKRLGADLVTIPNFSHQDVVLDIGGQTSKVVHKWLLKKVPEHFLWN